MYQIFKHFLIYDSPLHFSHYFISNLQYILTIVHMLLNRFYSGLHIYTLPIFLRVIWHWEDHTITPMSMEQPWKHGQIYTMDQQRTMIITKPDQRAIEKKTVWISNVPYMCCIYIIHNISGSSQYKDIVFLV